jgi:hypothetical protein
VRLQIREKKERNHTFSILVTTFSCRRTSINWAINEAIASKTVVNKESAWREWKLDKHTFKDEDYKSRKRRTFPVSQNTAGFPAGLTLLLSGEEDDPPCPQFDSSGYKVTPTYKLIQHIRKHAKYTNYKDGDSNLAYDKYTWNGSGSSVPEHFRTLQP